MKNLKSALRTMFEYFFVRANTGLTPEYTRILVYHRFSKRKTYDRLAESTFERQLKLIAENYQVISFDTYLSRRKNSESLTNTVIITVDDGYDDFYHIAYPILKKLQLPATIFVATDFIDKKAWFWPDKIKYILNNAEYVRTASQSAFDGASSDSSANGDTLFDKIADRMKEESEFDRRRKIVKLAQDCGVSLPEIPSSDYSPCSWEQLEEMSEQGISIQSHGVSHRSLSTLSRQETELELRRSKYRIAENFGHEPEFFAYPYGLRSDYKPEDLDILKRCDYSLAFVSFYDGDMSDGPYQVRRLPIGNNWRHFLKNVTGFNYLVFRAKRKLRRFFFALSTKRLTR